MGMLQWATVFLFLALVVGMQGFSGMVRRDRRTKEKSDKAVTLIKVVSGTFLAIAVALYVLVVLGIRPTV